MDALHAVVFDFDGLILDTETSILVAMQQVFDAHGAQLTTEEWARGAVGTHGGIDPLTLLEQRAAGPVDLAAAMLRYGAHRDALMAAETIRPGVVDLLDEAAEAGVACGVASSSDAEWVLGHLARLGLDDRFEVVVCRDEVLRAKPHPDVYVEACRRLGADPARSWALEDSGHGVDAALAAGLRCVAVPNPVTRVLDLSHAHLVVESLTDVTLMGLIELLGTDPASR